MAAAACLSADQNKHLQEKTYYLRLEKLAKKIPQDKLMRQNWINMMIVRIESAYKIIENDSLDNLHPKVKETLKNYYVAEVANPLKHTMEKKLFVKKEDSKKSWEAIPLTKTFEIVMEAHILTDHGGVAAMAQWLTNANVVVASICLKTLIGVCKECTKDALENQTTDGSVNENEQVTITILDDKTLEAKEEKEQGKEKALENISSECVKENKQEVCKDYPKQVPEDLKSCGIIALMDMSMHDSNQKLNYLLIYQDINTNFLQLRPVSSEDFVESSSNELVNVFSDMGPPDWLIVDKALKEVFVHVLDRLNQIFKPEIKMFSRERVSENLSLKVNVAMNNWLSQEAARKWYIGCFVIQWELNNVGDKDGTSPFQKVFGRSRNTNRNSEDTRILESIEDLNIKNSKAKGIDDFISENPILELPSDF